jgi:hypothetical protein
MSIGEMSLGAGATQQQSFLDRFAEMRRSLLGFGPFRFFEPILWLVLASSLRVLAERIPLAILLAQIPILFAFISGTARVIDLMQGRTQLTRMNFEETWHLSKVILKIFGIGFLFCLLAFIIAGEKDGSIGFIHFYLMAFDCIAFDSFFAMNKITSALVGLFVFFIVVNAGTGKQSTLLGAFDELLLRYKCMLRALLLVLAFLFILSELQGFVRPLVYDYVRTHGANNFMSKSIFYTFVVGFAYLRLTIIIAIYSYWLKKSYLSVSD